MNYIPLIMGILIALVTFFHGLGEQTADAKRYSHTDSAAKTAVRAALEEESWDLTATANAGTIILDETKAEQIAKDRFLTNQNFVGSVQIFVINNAPYSFSYNGLSQSFQSNGIVLVYELDGRTWLNTAEVDDF